MSQRRDGLVLGAHLSIAKGLPAALQRCHAVGANALQVFTRNPRGGRQRIAPDEELAQAAERRAALGVRALVAHLPYTVNLASPRPQAYEFACQVLRDDLRYADRMGAELLVVHPGSHAGAGLDAGTERIVRGVRQALAGYQGRTALLLEAMSGQGSEIGAEPEHHAAVFEGCDWHPALGICLDSAHQFAAGYDLRSAAGVRAMVRSFADAVGAERLRCLHLNDSRAPLGSHRDRHERIGLGHLGPAGIRALVRNRLLSKLPMCLETPVDEPMEYADEIQAVFALRASRARG